MDKPVRTDSHNATRSSRDLAFSLATCGSLFVLGTWSLTAAGCGTGMKTNEQRTAQRRNLNPSEQAKFVAKETAKNASNGKVKTANTGDAVATLGTPEPMVGALAGTVEDNFTTLVDMSNVKNGNSGPKGATLSEATIEPGQAPATTLAMAGKIGKQKYYLPNGQPAMRTSSMDDPNMTAMATNANSWNNKSPEWFAPNTNTTASSTQPTGTPTTTETGAPTKTLASSNGPATINQGTSWNNSGNNANPNQPTANGTMALNNDANSNDPMALSRLLANAFASSSSGSLDPLRVWFIYSSLAVSNPDLTLPEGWGQDLLPAERDRVTAAHAGFAALGRAFRDGATGIDSATRQALVAALVGEPSLTIPKVDLCTKVTGYGEYSPVQRRSFLAGSNNRVIVYSELDGFKSHLENGKWTTRLATRVSIVPASNNGNSIAWSRTPEWTEVVDTSDSPRCEFFLGEIIPISSSLAAGNYNVRVEVKDLTTGSTTSTVLPIEVLTERAFAAVND
jgi:hypothetical protein